MISFDDFAKLDLRIATVISAEHIAGSDKLLRLMVELEKSDENRITETRQIIAGIGKVYEPEELVDTQIVIVANLEPRKLMGFESQGMLLAANDPHGQVLLRPEKKVEPGTKIR